MQTDEPLEVYGPPAFRPGDKVRATRAVRNDGTIRGCEIGALVVKKGDVGYVRDVGTFLQQFYVYAIDFVERGTIVGMRRRELAAISEDAR